MKKKLIIISAIVILIVAIVLIFIFAKHEHKFAEEYSSDSSGHWFAPLCHEDKIKIKKEKHSFDGENLICKVCNYEFQKNQQYETIKSYFNSVGYHSIDIELTTNDATELFKLRYQEMFIDSNECLYIDFDSEQTTIYVKNDRGNVESSEVLNEVYTLEKYLRSNDEYKMLCELIDAFSTIRNNAKYNSKTNVVEFNNINPKDATINNLTGKMIFNGDDITELKHIELEFVCGYEDNDKSHTAKKYTAKITINDTPLVERPANEPSTPDVGPNGYIVSSMDEIEELMPLLGDFIVVDVRYAKEFADGHLPFAINIPNETIKNDSIPEQLKDYTGYILVYCKNGNRSKDAASKLVMLGFDKVVEFGGITDWDGPIEK